MARFIEGIVFITFAVLLVYAVINITKTKKKYNKTNDSENYEEF
jgi:hypothetical protein